MSRVAAAQRPSSARQLVDGSDAWFSNLAEGGALWGCPVRTPPSLRGWRCGRLPTGAAVIGLLGRSRIGDSVPVDRRSICRRPGRPGPAQRFAASHGGPTHAVPRLPTCPVGRRSDPWRCGAAPPNRRTTGQLRLTSSTGMKASRRQCCRLLRSAATCALRRRRSNGQSPLCSLGGLVRSRRDRRGIPSALAR
jgi:hypothetical protein